VQGGGKCLANKTKRDVPSSRTPRKHPGRENALRGGEGRKKWNKGAKWERRKREEKRGIPNFGGKKRSATEASRGAKARTWSKVKKLQEGRRKEKGRGERRDRITQKERRVEGGGKKPRGGFGQDVCAGGRKVDPGCEGGGSLKD